MHSPSRDWSGSAALYDKSDFNEINTMAKSKNEFICLFHFPLPSASQKILCDRFCNNSVNYSSYNPTIHSIYELTYRVYFLANHTSLWCYEFVSHYL